MFYFLRFLISQIVLLLMSPMLPDAYTEPFFGACEHEQNERQDQHGKREDHDHSHYEERSWSLTC